MMLEYREEADDDERDAYRLPQPLATVDIWSPGDTEESVAGTEDLHQLKHHQHELPGDCR
jgi:hypothetical protein